MGSTKDGIGHKTSLKPVWRCSGLTPERVHHGRDAAQLGMDKPVMERQVSTVLVGKAKRALITPLRQPESWLLSQFSADWPGGPDYFRRYKCQTFHI